MTRRWAHLLLGLAVAAAPLLWWPQRPVLLAAAATMGLAAAAWWHPQSVAATVFPVLAVATAALALGVEPPGFDGAPLVVGYAVALPVFLAGLDRIRLPAADLVAGAAIATAAVAIGRAELPTAFAVAGVAAVVLAIGAAVTGLRPR